MNQEYPNAKRPNEKNKTSGSKSFCNDGLAWLDSDTMRNDLHCAIAHATCGINEIGMDEINEIIENVVRAIKLRKPC